MNQSQKLYIELLKKVLTNLLRIDEVEIKPIKMFSSDYRAIGVKKAIGKTLFNILDNILLIKKFVICKIIEVDVEKRINGLDWPTYGETMMGLKRLNNIEECVIDIVKNNIPGDFIETGVWRGGGAIFMKAMLNVLDVSDRTVWLADSFEGLPEANGKKYSADKASIFHLYKELSVSAENVKKNFVRYDLFDDHVKFIKGWFKDTMPLIKTEKFALLRLDGDLYESTWDVIIHLYPKLSKGGYIIIDDYYAVEGCKLAVDDYRRQNAIAEEIINIDSSSIYWKKTT